MKENRLSLSKSRRLVEEYLKAPYARVLIPDAESGTYTAMIKEFLGCVTQGDTQLEALQQLEIAAKGWIEAALDLGQYIPMPEAEQEDYSGKFALRLPKSLHRQAAQIAERDGTSLNQFIVTAVAARAGAAELYSHIAEDLKQQLSDITACSLRQYGMIDVGRQSTWHFVPYGHRIGNDLWGTSDHRFFASSKPNVVLKSNDAIAEWISSDKVNDLEEIDAQKLALTS